MSKRLGRLAWPFLHKWGNMPAASSLHPKTESVVPFTPHSRAAWGPWSGTSRMCLKEGTLLNAESVIPYRLVLLLAETKIRN